MVVLRATLAMMLAGCFNPDLSDADIHCDIDGLCPVGLVCNSDAVCRPTLNGDSDGGGSNDGGAATCPDQDLGSALGAAVAAGDLADFDDDVRGCESGRNGRDATFGWTAPADATYRFTTCGSSFDTVLFLERDCSDDNDELACEDDGCGGGEDLQERLDYALSEGEQIIIAVGGWDGELGEFELGIEQLTGTLGVGRPGNSFTPEILTAFASERPTASSCRPVN